MESRSVGRAESGVAPLVVVVGETATGKTALALQLAERFNGEIICADSRTIYRELDIGTAKPSREDRARLRHYLVDIVEPNERFTAAEFKQLAGQAMEDIHRRRKLPIMVGGTGLYVDSVLFDYGFAPPSSERDAENPRHLSKEVPRVRRPLRANTLILGLQIDREVLKKRVSGRIERMVGEGVLEEVRRLSQYYGWEAPALQAPGYKAFREYLEGRIGLDEAKALFVKYDLALAKRQRTWFKRNKDIQWLPYDDAVEEATQRVAAFLHG